MALLYCDSFDHYANLVGKGWTIIQSGGAPVSTSTTISRSGPRSLHNGNDYRNGAYRTFAPAATVWAVLAFRFEVAPSGDITVVGFRDSGTVQLDVRVTPVPHRIRVTRNGTTLATGVTNLIPSTWYHLSLDAVIDPTTGSFDVKLNGVTEISGSGVNTRATANSSANQVQVLGAGPGMTGASYIDDFVFGDNSGPSNTAAIGDVRVEAILPTAAGAFSEWTPSAGSNWQNVDDVPANDDTDYNSSATATAKDTFAMANVTPTAGTVKAIQYALYARKDDAGSRVIAPMSRQSGVDYVSATSHPLGNSYAYYIQVKEANPATAAAWTLADVNTDAEFGYRLES